MHVESQPTPLGTSRYFPAFTVAAVAALSVLEAAAPAVAGIGLLACLPVLLASVSDDRRAVWVTAAAALLGYALVAFSGIGSSPPWWSATRGITLVSLASTAVLALLLQRRRVAAIALRDTAVSASELNQLLMSLLAHDLRAPLSLADEGFQYVEESVHGGYPIDRTLVADVRARLQRSLRAIEMVLSLAGDAERPEAGRPAMLRCVSPADEIAAEVASYTYEARRRGKRIELALVELGEDRYALNVAVLRQALAIPLDNAVRYALPGPIRVSAAVVDRRLEVRVEDSGPGISARREDGTPSGSGLGLRLCGALLARADGSLSILRDAPDGTTMALTLPVESAKREAAGGRSP